MGKERKKAPDDENGAPSKRDEELESGSGTGSESDNDSRRSEGSRHSRRKRKRSRSRSRSSSRKSREDEEDSYTSSSESESSDDSYSDESVSSEDNSESEGERRRRKRKERRKREEREKEKQRRRRKEKEKKRRRKEREEKRRKKHKEKKKKRDKEKGKKGAVTNSWGKYGIIRETDMWNKRPEFTAWLAEVKQVNLESLPNWEEKQMFKEFMEDHNTATFPSKKYYNLDAYHRHQIEKEMKRGPRKVRETERTVFDDEEQRRQELLREREILKEEQVEALKCSMLQGGLAQAMKDQALLKEEMAYQYKIGNFEAAAAIQRRLDPDIPM